MTIQERDAWTLAYRLYEEYAPKARAAAALDDDNETAGRVFIAALERIKPHLNSNGNDGNWILIGVYDILEYIFKDARRRRQGERRQI